MSQYNITKDHQRGKNIKLVFYQRGIRTFNLYVDTINNRIYPNAWFYHYKNNLHLWETNKWKEYVDAVRGSRSESLNNKINLEKLVDHRGRTSPIVENPKTYKTQKEKKNVIEAQGHFDMASIDRAIFNAKISDRVGNLSNLSGLGKGKKAISSLEYRRKKSSKKESKLSHSKSSEPQSSSKDLKIKKAELLKTLARCNIEAQGLFDNFKVTHEVPDEVTKLLSGILDIVSKFDLGESMTKVHDAISKVADSVKSLKDGGINLNHTLGGSLMGLISDNICVLSFLVLAFIGLTFRNFSGTPFMIALIGFVSSFVRSHYKDMSDSVSSMFSSIVGWFSNPHSDIVPHGLSTNIVEIILAYLYYGHFAKSLEKKMATDIFSSFFERTANMRKVKEGAEFSFNFLLKKLQSFLDYLSHKFKFEKFHVAMDNMPEITSYAERVDALVQEHSRGKVLNFESAEDILSIHREGSKLMKSLPSGPEFLEARKLCLASMSELSPLLNKIKRCNLYNNGPRVEPVGVLFTGPPGIGKTTSLIPILLAVTATVLPEDKKNAFKINHNDFIYNRIAENVFFDSYNGQFNCIFDDLGQIKDVAGVSNNPYMEFIRMVNSNNMDLHMAHLEDKGNINFRSKIVWATSNTREFRLNSIIRSDALTRRFRCSFIVLPARGFREDESVVDFWKMKLRKGCHQEDYSHLMWMQFDSLEGRIVDNKEWSISEVINFIINEVENNDIVGDRLLASQQAMKDKYLSIRENKESLGPIPQIAPPLEEPSFAHKYFPHWKRKNGDGFIDEKDDIEAQSNCKISMTYAEILELAGLYNFSLEDVKFYFPNANEIYGVSGEFTIDELASLLDSIAAKKPITSVLFDRICRYKEKCRIYYSEMFSGKNSSNPLSFIELVVNAFLFGRALRAFVGMISGCITKLCGGTSSPEKEKENLIPNPPDDFQYELYWDPVRERERGKSLDPETLVALEKFDKGELTRLEIQSSLRSRHFGNRTAKRKEATQRFVRQLGKGHKQSRGNVTIIPQLAYDSNCNDIMTKIFKRNMYSIRVGGSSVVMGHFFFIAGHDAVMPLHFMERMLERVHLGHIPEDHPVEIFPCSNVESKFSIALNQLECFYPDEWGDDDVCFVRFPNVIPNSPDIRKYILEDFSIITDRFTGSLLIPDGKGNSRINTTYMSSVSNVPYEGYVSLNAVSYNIPTAVGDCGSLCCVVNATTGAKKVIGFHVAGNKYGGAGYAVRLSKSMVDQFYNFFDEPEVVDTIGALDKTLTDKEIEPQGFKVLHTARRANAPINTNIVPSPLQNVFCESCYHPTHLKPFEKDGIVIDPWILSRKNYRKDTMLMDLDVLKICNNSYINRMMIKTSNDVSWNPRVFSFEEAVRGIPGIQNCEGIPRNTSSGYPLNLDVPPGESGKSHFFGKDGDYEFDSPLCLDMIEQVKTVISNAKKGLRMDHIYNDFLKDERRLKSKVDSGKARLVSASPLVLLIVMRMYFMDFVRWYMNNRLHNGSAVGINPYSTDWDVLFKLLNGGRDRKNIIAGDFKAYDGSISRQIMVQFLDFINRWYSDGNDRIRTVLFEEVCNSKHIFEDMVYEWDGGNPSGGFLTTILNTYCNNLIMRYGFLLCLSHNLGYDTQVPKLCDREIKEGLNLFEENVAMFAFGDDNILSVNVEAVPWFNQNTLSHNLPKFGFEYTMEDKSSLNSEPFRNIFSTSFLKRKWRHEPMYGKMVAPLEIGVILEMAQWTKKKDRDFKYVRINVDNALKELSAHDPVVWERWCEPIKRAAQIKLDHFSTITDRRNALALQLSRDDFNQE